MQATSSYQNYSINPQSSIHCILLELDQKIYQISNLKNQIKNKVQNNGLDKLEKDEDYHQNVSKFREKFIKNKIVELSYDWKDSMMKEIHINLQKFNNQSISATMDIINYYECQINKYKTYYESQIQELQEEIKRQYKVIAMMKQQVQDLMILMKYKEDQLTNEQDLANPQEKQCYQGEENLEERTTHVFKYKNLKLNGVENKDRGNELDVIEQQTQRTIQSSQSSVSNQQQQSESGMQFIKIQEEQEQSCKLIIKNRSDQTGLVEQQDDALQPNLLKQFHKHAKSQQMSKCVKQQQIIENIGQFCQHLTPNQADRKQISNIYKAQSIFHLNTVSIHEETARHKEKGKMNITNLNQQNKGKSFLDKKCRVYTTPSGDSKTDHLQSIFFLDDEPSNCHQQANYSKQMKQYKQMSEQQTNEFIFEKINKVINIGQFQTFPSMPVSTKNNPLHEIPPNNCSQQTSQRNLSSSKPKTKQFLQQFRKTFSKCLSSMQNSKKYSTKMLNSSKNNTKQHNASPHNQNQNSYCLVNGMSINRPNSNSQHLLSLKEESLKAKENIQFFEKEKEIIHEGKQNSMKAVDHMLKQLQNNNKFVTGSKKIELKFEGEKKNGIRCGNGILYYSNGLCYEGQFKDGMRHGYGTLKFNHIEIYNGEWVKDQIEGEGRIRNCAIINKRKGTSSTHGPLGKWISYNGQFKNSKFQGQGTLHLQGGQKFVGTFINGYAHGEGSICRKNGDVEFGLWQNSIMIHRQMKK